MRLIERKGKHPRPIDAKDKNIFFVNAEVCNDILVKMAYTIYLFFELNFVAVIRL